MIVKFATEKGWILFDNIMEVTLSDGKHGIEGTMEAITVSDVGAATKEYRTLEIKKTDYSHMYIYTNGDVFVCNDNGKTIERI